MREIKFPKKREALLKYWHGENWSEEDQKSKGWAEDPEDAKELEEGEDFVCPHCEKEIALEWSEDCDCGCCHG